MVKKNRVFVCNTAIRVFFSKVAIKYYPAPASQTMAPGMILQLNKTLIFKKRHT